MKPSELLCFKDTINSTVALFFLSGRHAIRNSKRQMRQLSRMMQMNIHLTFGWRRDETGLTNTHPARGFSDLHHVFARKQCILCSTLRHKYYMLHRFESFSIFSASGTVAHGSMRLSPRSLASSREEKLGLMVHIYVWLSLGKRGSKSLIFQTFFILVEDVMWPGHIN